MQLEPGIRISENLELRSLVGEGGMGQVWAAFHGGLQRTVAVKFLSGPLAENAGALQRFALEAQTIGRLQCDYVPQVFDVGRLPDGAPFIVMELLDGADLQTRLTTGGPLSVHEVERLVSQVGEVLSLAHGLGLVHRDVKPSNIVLVPSKDGAFTAKLLDFGIVRDLDVDQGSGTGTGMTIGTPSFMSPELLVSSKNVDARADLWALAVVAYGCLTGELPFAGETFGAVCLSIHERPLVEPSTLRPGLPSPVDAWFRRALNRAPEERFASAAEMCAAFAAAVDDGMQPRRRRPGWGRNAVAFLLLAAALVFVARRSGAPAFTPDWGSAARGARALVGSVARGAASLANEGSSTATVDEALEPTSTVREAPSPLREAPTPILRVVESAPQAAPVETTVEAPLSAPLRLLSPTPNETATPAAVDNPYTDPEN